MPQPILLDLLAHFGWHRKAPIFAAYIFMSGGLNPHFRRRTAMFLCALLPSCASETSRTTVYGYFSKEVSQPNLDIYIYIYIINNYIYIYLKFSSMSKGLL